MQRDDDQRWRERTDERLTSLTTGDLVQNDRLDSVEEQVETLDKILRGNGNAADGIVSDVDRLLSELRRLNAILMPDAIGNAGLINEVRKLLKRDERDERRADRWWKGLTPIIVAIVSSATLVITQLDKIEPVIKQFFAGSVSSEIQAKAKHNPGRRAKKHRVIEPVETPKEETSDEQ